MEVTQRETCVNLRANTVNNRITAQMVYLVTSVMILIIDLKFSNPGLLAQCQKIVFFKDFEKMHRGDPCIMSILAQKSKKMTLLIK